MGKRLVCMLSTVFFTLGLSCNSVYAKEYNEAYTEYLQKEEIGQADGLNIPCAYEIEGTSIKGSYREASNISKYDPRLLNLVTPIKNQGTLDTCWTFGSLGALESFLLHKGYGSYDFSEEHLKWWATLNDEGYGWNRRSYAGAYDSTSIGYFTSWCGPKLESEIPYSYIKYGTKPSNMNEAKTAFNISDIMYLKNDKETVKNAIIQYGAVYTGYYHSNSSSYYDSTKGTYCYSGSRTPTNHAIVIVGWDDNYSKDNFKQSSNINNNGAWLIKNSWGNNNNEGGYLWISYEDTSILDDGYNVNYCILDAQEANDNLKLYQYDEEGAVYTFKYLNESGEYDKTLYCGNSFEFSEEYNILQSVVFESTNIGAKYTIDYIPYENNNINLNNKVTLYSGIINYAGYINCDLEDYILPSGKGIIAVSIDNTANNKAASIGCQENLVYSSGEYLYKAKVNLGESYVIKDGQVQDINVYDSSELRNLSIKAITKKSNDTTLSSVYLGDVNIDLSSDTILPENYKNTTQVLKLKTNNSYGKIISVNNTKYNLNEVEHNISLEDTNSSIEVICEAPDGTIKTYNINIKFNIINPPIEESKAPVISSFTVDKISPQLSGTKVNLTASADGSGKLEYKFIIKDNAKGNWYKIRDFEKSNTCTWTAGSVGNKTLYVDVRDNYGNVSRSQMSYSVIDKIAPPVINSFTTDKASPQFKNTKITLSTQATGFGDLEYKFIIRDDKGNWYKLQDYCSNNKSQWYASVIGNKTLYVDVKDEYGNVTRKGISYIILEQSTYELSEKSTLYNVAKSLSYTSSEVKTEENKNIEGSFVNNKVILSKKGISSNSNIKTGDDLNTKGFLVTMTIFWVALIIIIHFNRKKEKSQKQDK